MKLKALLWVVVLLCSLHLNISLAIGKPGFTEIFSSDEQGATALDATDPLSFYRKKFLIPTNDEGQEPIYLNGHVMGLAPVEAQSYMISEINEWAKKASEKRYEGDNPWYSFHEKLKGSFAKLLGAMPEEIVLMNSLSTNLHLAMISFYKPTKSRFKIVMEAPLYVADLFIVKSQLKLHGLDPEEALIVVEPDPNIKFLRLEDFERVFAENRDSIALVFISKINHLTGQVMDTESLTKLAHANGAMVGLNLAHAVGNIKLKLHKNDVDFAAWCNYKYMSGGPGAVGGLFIHKRHVGNPQLHRLAGWWGSDPQTRFKDDKAREFIPMVSADAWQPSEPQVFSMVPLQASLKIFDEVGIDAYREKSIRLTSYLEYLIDYVHAEEVEIITPRDINQRGAQISLLISRNAENFYKTLQQRRIICDFKAPNIIRVAPVPFYNSYHDVWNFVNVLSEFFKGKPIEKL
ncbi:MAG: kynureninase [Rickettsiaceae bacterium]